MQSSRLTRTSKEKTKRQIIFFAVAILVLLFVLSQFGGYALSSISNFTSRFSTNKPDIAVADKNTLEAPFINSIPEATNSASIHISGSSSYSDAAVELYINGTRYDSTPLSSDQKFSFDDVGLRDGGNIIKARVKKGDQLSDFTREYTVILNKDDVKLEVASPSDGATFTRGDQTITVQGTTNPNGTVTVNGFRAIVDEAGNFSYYLNLAEGDNNITIDAQSESGKTASKSLKVTFKP